jgi:hypothetical protein
VFHRVVKQDVGEKDKFQTHDYILLGHLIMNDFGEVGYPVNYIFKNI